MQISLKVVLIFLVMLYLFFIAKGVKHKNMRINYLIFWSIMGIILIIALLIPNLVSNISNFLGFELPINMIFSIGIFLILYLIFDLTKQITQEQNKSTMLIQEISILKEKINELEGK